MSELWKNAYDAYARSAALHIFGGEVPIAAVVDDGHGMSKAEFVSRWLMLGTEAKAGEDEVPEEDRDGLPLRVRQGQKGIGRLSLAYLGPTVLVLTKRANKGFVAALLDWRLFQNPYLALDDVLVPVEEFDEQGQFPAVMSQLFDGLIDNVWGSKADPARRERLENAWRRFSEDEVARGDANSADQIANLALSGRLAEEHLDVWQAWTGARDRGTAMFVFDVVQELRVWIDRGLLEEDPEVSEVRDNLRKTLTGFTDPYRAEAGDFVYKVLSHVGGSDKTILSAGKTFDIDQLRDLEHVVEGRFDESGLFTGRVRAWGKDLGEVVLAPSRPPPLRGRSYVGPFDISFGTFELEEKNSTHSADVIGRLKELADRLSGLAVYRDGIRVQPYGRPKADLFGMEERRGGHAGREFWVHRRTFGRVAITREGNAQLRDKAGREGLIDNRAAREFRLLVVELLRTLARRYFGSDSELRSAEIERTQALYALSKEAEERARRRRVSTLKTALKDNASPLAAELMKARSLAATISDHVSAIDWEELAVSLAAAQTNRAALALPPRPRKLSPAVEEKYRDYRDGFNELTALLETATHEWSERVENESQQSPEDIVRSAVGRHQKFITDAIKRWKRAITSVLADEDSRWSARVKEDNVRYHQLASPLLQEMGAGRIPVATVLAELEAIQKRLHNELAPEYEGYLRALQAMGEGIDLDAALAWATDERTVLVDRVAQWQDLAQLGVTVEIVGHELNETAAQVSRNLARLPRSAQETAPFKLARDGFRALVHRLEFLAPLRLSGPRTRRRITGQELEQYLRDFFERQLVDRGIELVATAAFRETSVVEYSHRVFPVFVNLVNNALYWVTMREERRVLLDRRGHEIYVADTGPGVDPDDEDNLFDLFFTRRVEGHGVGLYLSRIALEQGRHQIRLAAPPERILPGANFIITFRELQDGQ